MDARGWNGEPDARDDALEHDGHVRLSRERQFEIACATLQQWIATACDARQPDWAAYRGSAQGNAIWYARHCYREARKLGLYPSLAQLKAEAEQAAA